MDASELWFLNSYQGADDQISFGNAVIAMANNISVSPNYLMWAFRTESGLSPSAVNPTSGAAGLIQFMPSTAASLGTTTDVIKQLSGIEQLPLVQRYLQGVISQHGQLNTLTDVYLAIFFPAAINQSPDFVLQAPGLSAQLVASENKTFAAGKDYITVQDVTNFINNRLPGTFLADVQTAEIFVKKNVVGLAIAGVGVILMVFFILKATSKK